MSRPGYFAIILKSGFFLLVCRYWDLNIKKRRIKNLSLLRLELLSECKRRKIAGKDNKPELVCAILEFGDKNAIRENDHYNLQDEENDDTNDQTIPM